MPSTCNTKGFQRSQYSPFKNTTSTIINKSNNDINDFKTRPTTTTTTERNVVHNNCHFDDDDDHNIHNNENYHFTPDSDDLFISEFLIKDAQCQSILNPGEDDEMLITGYKRSIIRTIICWLFVILTGGLLRLILHWWRHWYLLATHKECRLDFAEKILIREDYQGKHQLYYVKDVITLNLETLTKMKSDKNKTAQYFPNDDTIDDKQFFLSVHFSSGNFRRTNEIRLFRCKQLRYIWDNQSLSFQKLQGLDINIPSNYLHQRKGLTKYEQNGRRLVYGKNEITIPIKGVMTLLFLEALNPFYVFQIFSVCLWISYNYYYYAAVIVLMSGFGITMSIIQTKKNQDALRNTVQHSDCAIVVLDDGTVEHTVTDNLVPGDLIEIPSSGCLMHCDAVLLSGNCILDESILTGESVPVTKTPLPIKRDLIFDKKEHSRHTLFCGTKVMQTRYIGSEKVLAIVINTGNITAKGGLIRSILYPPPVDYKFEQDSYKFITLLGFVAGIGFVYTLVTKIFRSVSAAKIAIESLDLITIAVPPALPAAMTVGRYYAQKRLERNNIYCISPRSINVSGSIDCVCFDKTGTLTEDGLDMWGVVPKTTTNQFQMPLKQIDRLPSDHLLYGMVTCHSITIMNGVMKGDPLDLKMFESTGWVLEEANVADDNKYDLLFPTIVRRPKSITTIENSRNNTNNSINDLTNNIDNNCIISSIKSLAAETTSLSSSSSSSDDDDDKIDLKYNNNISDEDLYTNSTDIGIVREFPFTSTLQRMSVVTRLLSDNHFNVYCKGSPEMIQTLCRQDTIPDNYLNQLNIYAQQGYRIIALAYKPLDKKITYPRVQRIGRDKIESDLEFQGFVILENRLKPDTTDVIKNLTKANIRTVMVTGDNILTALSVAKDCDMITKNQCVITVNTRPHLTESNKYELYYNLIGIQPTDITTSTTLKNNNYNNDNDNDDDDNNEITNNNGDIYSIMTNSNSIASLETIDTWTHRDIETGITPTTTTTTTTKSPIIIDDNDDNKNIMNNKKSSLRKRFFNFNKNTSIKKNNNNNNNKNKIYNNDYNNDNDNNQLYDTDLLHNNYRFAMVGKTWSIIREHFPELLDNFCTRGTIFARMSPDQKQSLILQLQDLGYYVAMCGDGANDCGALKAAHTGISLSEAESSVASPFTSKKSTIACVPNVIKEGRAALVTSFGIFKYMAAYSLVQFISVLILYSIDSNLTDIQFLYIDLGLISIFAFFFGRTEAYDGPLVKYPPLNSLIAISPIISLLLHLIVAISIQIISWYHVKSEEWYEPFDLTKAKTEFDLSCYENYTIFIITCYQYIILAFVLSKGKPYRKSIISNIPFLLTLIINLLLVIYLTINPATFLINWFELILPPDNKFRIILLIYGLINFLLSLFIELFIIEYIIFYKFNKLINKNNYKKLRYLKINNDLKYNLKWPPITSINQIDLINTTKYDNDKSSPISYAEISAEHTIDLKAPENSVLNNFFDSKQQQQQPNDNDDNIKNDNLIKTILIIDNSNNNTASTSGDNLLNIKKNININDNDNNNNIDNNNDNDCGDDTIDDEQFSFSLSHSELSDYESAKNELLNDSQININKSQQSIISINKLNNCNLIESSSSIDDIYLPTISNNSIDILFDNKKNIPINQQKYNNNKSLLNNYDKNNSLSSSSISIFINNNDNNIIDDNNIIIKDNDNINKDNNDYIYNNYHNHQNYDKNQYQQNNDDINNYINGFEMQLNPTKLSSSITTTTTTALPSSINNISLSSSSSIIVNDNNDDSSFCKNNDKNYLYNNDDKKKKNIIDIIDNNVNNSIQINKNNDNNYCCSCNNIDDDDDENCKINDLYNNKKPCNNSKSNNICNNCCINSSKTKIDINEKLS